MDDIVIIGAGGFAKEIAFLIDDINRQKKQWNLLGFIDKGINTKGKNNGKYKVLETDDWLVKYKNKIHVVFAIGNPIINYQLFKKLKINNNIIFPNIIHPTVIADWRQIKIGHGNVVCAQSILTTNILIGSFNMINLRTIIGHDCVIGSYNVINPAAMFSGNVRMQNLNLIGTHSKIIQGINIGSNIKVAVGSVVMSNIIKKGTYLGTPAKRLKE